MWLLGTRGVRIIRHSPLPIGKKFVKVCASSKYSTPETIRTSPDDTCMLTFIDKARPKPIRLNTQPLQIARNTWPTRRYPEKKGDELQATIFRSGAHTVRRHHQTKQRRTSPDCSPLTSPSKPRPLYLFLFGFVPARTARSHVKVASSQTILASSGALQNLTQLLPPSLATYVDATISQLSEAVSGSNEYIAAQGISPTVLYSTLVCAALVIPFGMSRFPGWPSGRDGLSPYASQNSDGIPRVTDDDFSYITSEDLEQSLRSPSRTYDPHGRKPPASADIEDDVLLIKNKGITQPVPFPAYSIGDGKLYVHDVRERIAWLMKISEQRSQKIKMLYKGRNLKVDPSRPVPVREYGVKNNSEILVVLPEGNESDDDDSDSSEEIIVTDPRDGQKSKKSKKSKKGGKKKKSKSPRDSNSNLDVPNSAEAERRSSADGPKIPSRVPSPAAPLGPLEKLDSISSHFNTKFLPLCVEFSANPPRDDKKCIDEHRKLSETIMQQVLLKLDEVETGGDPDIRARRKQLVNQVHDVLRGIDEHLPEGATKSNW
ncbi:BAG domain-containing protein [Apiospora kogelbergensis]|uniref:BAG domain-containing protein n=1 Tax=Apiospora kogelbergensis TaxID=1337665 RepID=A0AAW0QDZ1_9PEZI